VLKDVADGVLAGRFDGPGAARGAEQGFDGVVHGLVAPVAYDLAVAGGAEAGVGEGGFEVARGRQGVGGVVGGAVGRDEGAHRLVHDGALGAFGRGEQAGHHAAARTGDAGRLAQRLLGVAGELERVDAGHRVERGVWVGQRFQVAFTQVSVGQPVAGDAEEAGADVQAGGDGASLFRQHQGKAGAAAHVEQAGTRADAGGVQDRLEQRPVVRLGQVRPGLRVGAPQAALDLRGGAEVHRRRAWRRACMPSMTSLRRCSSTG